MTLAAWLTLSLTLQAPAVVIAVRGTAEVDTGSQTRPVQRFDAIEEGATIRTGEDATVQLRMASGSTVRLGPATEVALSRLEQGTPAAKRKESIRLVVGRLWARVTSLMGADSTFDVETENAVAGVRGTSFVVDASQAGSRFVLLEGALQLLRQGGEPVRLDRPNGFIDAGPGGFGEIGALDEGELVVLQERLGGSTARMLRRLGDGAAGAQPPADGNLREATRRDILGPGQLSDTSLGAAVTGATGGGRAILDVTIVLPEPTGGTATGVSRQ